MMAENLFEKILGGLIFRVLRAEKSTFKTDPSSLSFILMTCSQKEEEEQDENA